MRDQILARWLENTFAAQQRRIAERLAKVGQRKQPREPQIEVTVLTLRGLRTRQHYDVVMPDKVKEPKS